jgi:hypothetical protein
VNQSLTSSPSRKRWVQLGAITAGAVACLFRAAQQLDEAFRP